jgi:hypothetical protein
MSLHIGDPESPWPNTVGDTEWPNIPGLRLLPYCTISMQQEMVNNERRYSANGRSLRHLFSMLDTVEADHFMLQVRAHTPMGTSPGPSISSTGIMPLRHVVQSCATHGDLLLSGAREIVGVGHFKFESGHGPGVYEDPRYAPIYSGSMAAQLGRLVRRIMWTE